MLGKLARWLRLLGYDAAYRKHVDDDELLEEAEATGRVLLTRDVELAERARGGAAATVLLRRLNPRDQVAEVVEALELEVPADQVLTRCSLCNTPVDAVPQEEVAGDLPPDVASGDGPAWRCPGCGQVYWEGTHVAEIRSLAASLRDRGKGSRGDRQPL